MTLIVGRVDKGRVILIGDSKLTYISRNSNSYLEGCLKLYRINPKLALGFAGIVEDFEQIFSDLGKFTNASDLIHEALFLKKKKRLDFDLLVAQADKNYLYVLKEYEISTSTVAHIGDIDAFTAFQKSYAESKNFTSVETGRASISITLLPEPIWEENQYLRMISAFKSVIQQEDIKSVDGILTPLCTHNGVFQYIHYVDAISDPFEITKVVNSGKPIDFGTTEYGSFSVEFCDTKPYGGCYEDIGFYFLQGNFGVIFPRDRNGLRRPKIIKAKNPAFWVLNTSKEYGYGVSSGYMTPDHCGIAAESLMKHQKWDDAFFCYELGKNAKDLKKRPAIFDRFMAGYTLSMFNIGKKNESIKLLKTLLAENTSLTLCKKMYSQINAYKFSPIPIYFNLTFG